MINVNVCCKCAQSIENVIQSSQVTCYKLANKSIL